ncbi:hypothetical protein FJ934_01510 [Mesorhizobium sp. B2-4-12]|uniref:hypothetical protein n=1 Tax=Mesorhizobium sp. B2-4-12 TaxID=2589937 RepID=UPI00112A91A2|nr:hypothetical protein [Mesorhizobium sp. B2-4-12]TPK99158.1 hypothetical protein FJ934_01510 [Mesorhizobium sp. B2-4-12]
MNNIELTMRINAVIFRDHYEPHVKRAIRLLERAREVGVSVEWKDIGDDIGTRFCPRDGVTQINQNYGKRNDKIRIRWSAFEQKIDYFFDHFNRRFNEPFIDDSIHIRISTKPCTDLIVERIQRQIIRKDRQSNGAFFDRMVLIGADLFACDTLFNSVEASGWQTRGHRLFPWIDMTKWRRWDQQPDCAEFLAPDERLVFFSDGTPMISRPSSGYMTNYHAVPGWFHDLVKRPMH